MTTIEHTDGDCLPCDAAILASEVLGLLLRADQDGLRQSAQDALAAGYGVALAQMGDCDIDGLRRTIATCRFIAGERMPPVLRTLHLCRMGDRIWVGQVDGEIAGQLQARG